MHILYVEDNYLVRNTIRETLELEGWTVEACADGWAGLKKIESGEHYDLILLDNDLPLIDGLELARRARQSQQHASTPIVMVSAGNIKGEARLAGINEFLGKPEDTHLIVDTIRRLLHA